MSKQGCDWPVVALSSWTRFNDRTNSLWPERINWNERLHTVIFFLSHLPLAAKFIEKKHLTFSMFIILNMRPRKSAIYTAHKKWSFSLRICSVNVTKYAKIWKNTEKIFNGKLHFCAVSLFIVVRKLLSYLSISVSSFSLF